VAGGIWINLCLPKWEGKMSGRKKLFRELGVIGAIRRDSMEGNVGLETGFSLRRRGRGISEKKRTLTSEQRGR